MKKKNKKSLKASEIKFESKQLKNTTVDHDNSAVVTFIIAFIVIAILVGGLYWLNATYVSKDINGKEETTETTTEVSYDGSIISVDEMFNQKDSEYMVLLYDFKKNDASYYTNLVNGYQGDNKIYSIDLSKGMNKKYLDENGKENTNPTKSSEVLVKGTTLITIKKGKVVSYTSDTKEIFSTIKSVKFDK